MSTLKKVAGLCSSLLLIAGVSITHAEKRVHPLLKPVTWKGAKWEYMVEHPSEVRYIHTIRFEELMDTLGQHGWELTEVTDENQFFAFYFKRPLLEEKLAAHRQRLSKILTERLQKEAALKKRIQEAHQKADQLNIEKKALIEKMKQEKQIKLAEIQKNLEKEKQLQGMIEKGTATPIQKKEEESILQKLKQLTSKELQEEQKIDLLVQGSSVAKETVKDNRQLIQEEKNILKTEQQQEKSLEQQLQTDIEKSTAAQKEKQQEEQLLGQVEKETALTMREQALEDHYRKLLGTTEKEQQFEQRLIKEMEQETALL